MTAEVAPPPVAAPDSATATGSRVDHGRRLVVAVTLALLGWSLWGAGIGREPVVNAGGWEVMSKFWAAAVRPELDPDFLRLTWDSTATTVAFAVLGTALAVAIGLVGGVAMSATWWQRERDGRRRRGWHAARGLGALPRGVHEAMWALFLVNVLGRDPLVGVLAIALPFGAITAKVYADILDDHADAPYAVLRAEGAGRVVALAYGVLPRALPELVSYAFYRLECSIRSAVILGIIGAGGLGFQLNLSFTSLRYGEMWTLMYALMVICALTDLWSSALRRSSTRPGEKRMIDARVMVRSSILVGIVLVGWSVLHLDIDPTTLWSTRTRALASDLAGAAWPPSLPIDGWPELLSRSIQTVQMSILAMVLATSLAVAVAFVAARPRHSSASRRAVAAVARAALLVMRAIPPIVWALIVLFVLFPGPVPGAVALGIYNFGVLGRLLAEVVENLDEYPAATLRAAGAPRASAFLYGALPLASPRFASYALYRWEVAMRETVVVGLVGAGGLGRLLAEQNVAFDFAGMLGTTIAFVALTVLVDAASAAARRALR